MSSTIGTKKAARILPLPAASGSQVKTASCQCISIWNTATDSTILHPISSPSTRTPPSGLTAAVLLPRLQPTYTVPPPSSSLRHARARSNQRCGSHDSGHRVRVNSTSFPATSLAHHRSSNTTPSVQSTSKNRPTSESRLHNASRNGFPRVVRSSLWTSDLCEPRPATISDPTNTPTGSSLPTTATPPI